MAPAPITQTGIRGFLIWFKREQPALFDKIAPKLPAVAPRAFGNYLQDRRKLKAIYRSGVVKRAGLGGQAFGDYYLPTVNVSAPAYVSNPVTVNYMSQLSAPVDYVASVPPVSTYVNAGDLTPIPPIAAAANSGGASTPTANAIGQVVGAAASIYMTQQNAALQQSVVQSQLARAAAGLPPLNTSLAQLGIPTVGTGISSTDGLVFLGIGAVVLMALMGNKK